MPGGTCRKVSTFLEEKGNAMKHERVACCHLYACMAELLGIKDLRIFVFCRHAGVSCANASLGAPTMHDHLRCLAEIVWHDSQRTHRFC